MGTIASLNLVLSAQTKELDSNLDKATAKVKRFGSDVEAVRKKTEANGGLFGGLGKSLKDAAMEERRGGGKQIQQLLMGGSVGMTGMLTEVIHRDVEKMGESVRKALKGQGDMGDVAEEFMGNLPVIGQGWQTGRAIKRGAQDFYALWKESHGSSRAEAFDSMSDETQEEFRNKMAEMHKHMSEDNKRLLSDREQRGLSTSLIGLKGSDRFAQQAKVNARQNILDVRKANEELHDLAEQMNDPTNEAFRYMSDTDKRNMMRQHSNALQGDVTSKAAERAAALKEQLEQYNEAKGDMLRSGGERNSDIKSSYIQQGLAANGHTHLAYLEGLDQSYKRGISAVDEWEKKNAEAYPDAAKKIKAVADEQRHLLANQKHMAEQVPLMAALRGIGDAHDYARQDFLGNPFAKQLHDLQEMGATQKQLEKARTLMQITADVPLAKQIHDQSRTPLEQLKKDMTDLNRLKDEDLITPQDYERRKGDLADNTRKALGLFGDPQKVGAMEMQNGFTVRAEPQLADPISKLLGVQTNTLKESQRQRIALEKLIQNNATILSLDDLPGNGK